MEPPAIDRQASVRVGIGLIVYGLITAMVLWSLTHELFISAFGGSFVLIGLMSVMFVGLSFLPERFRIRISRLRARIEDAPQLLRSVMWVLAVASFIPLPQPWQHYIGFVSGLFLAAFFFWLTGWRQDGRSN